MESEKEKEFEGIHSQLFPDDFFYENGEIAREEFARAFITGNGIKTRGEVSELLENIEDSAEKLAELAEIYGEKHQRNIHPKHWEFYISFVITDYIQQ